MEKKFLTVVIGFFIIFIILQTGPIWDYLVNIDGSYQFQAAKWIYGAITLNTITTIIIGYLILKKMK